MKWTSKIQDLLLLFAFSGLVTCDFWDDLADAVEDVVDENIGGDGDFDTGIDVLDDILDGAKDVLDTAEGILPGGNIGGDENSIFDVFTPVETGASNEDGDSLEALLQQLRDIAGQIGDLVLSDGDLSQDDILEALSALILDGENSPENPDEVSEFLLTAMLDFVLEDLGINVRDEMVEDRLVPLIMDVYNVVREYTSNSTLSGDSVELDLIQDVLDAVVDNVFPNMTREDIFCRAASNVVERFVEEVPNLERDAQKTMVRNLALLALGCQTEELRQTFSDQGGQLKDMIIASLNGTLIQQILEATKSGIPETLLNDTLPSMLGGRFANFTRLNNPLLPPWLQNNLRPSLPSRLNNLTRNIADMSRLRDLWQPFEDFDGVRTLLDSFMDRRGGAEDPATTGLPEQATDKDEITTTSRTTFRTLQTVKESETTIFPTASPTWPTVTTTTTSTPTKLQSTASPTTTLVTSTAATTTKNATNATTSLPTVPTPATATAANSTRSPFPGLMRRERLRELRGNLRDAVTNATERLVQLVREEIRSSDLAQLISTLLESDLVRQVLQALDIQLNPVQTTVMTMTSTETVTTTVANRSILPFSTNVADITRVSPETEPVARAMTQTTIQVLQTANLTDPASIVSTLTQILVDNARQTIQDEVLSDPLEFVRGVVEFVSRNNSLLSRIIPQETIAAVTARIGPALQATEFASSLAQIYSTSGMYGTSQRCTAERAAVGEGITQVQVWALTFLDSMGKLGTGFLQGNTWLEGNYDQCKGIYRTTENGDVIEGQYVKMKIRVQIPGVETGGSASLNDLDTGLPNIIWHVCLPKGCNSEDVTKIGDTIAESAGTSIESVQATILEKRDPETHDAFIIAVVMVSALGLLCLVGTAVDVATTNTGTGAKKPEVAGQAIPKAASRSKKSKTERQQANDEEVRSPTGEKMIRSSSFRELRADLRRVSESQGEGEALSAPPSASASQKTKNGLAKFFMAFSVYTNTHDVMKAAHAPGDLTCLHGIRVISILWVILGHIYVFMPQFGNAIVLVDMSKWWTFNGILNAPYAVDTFFTISGCLVSYLFLRTAKRAGGLKVPHMVMYYVHRYLRLTPLYALAILIYHGITPYMEEGPFLAHDSDRDHDCKDLWWTNLLYFSNLRKDTRQCMGWSWYLPNDMQFYAAAPLILVPLALGYKYLGLLVAFLQVALHLIMYAVMAEKYNASLIREPSDFFINIYIKPYTRCGPYAIGLALGYLLYKTKGKMKIPKVLVGLGWLLAIGGALTLVYVTHDNLEEFGILRPTWSDNQMNALDIVGKPLWSLCVAWVILACVTGYGGVINSFLSWTAWVPLSRLTFGTYLVHPMVMYYFNNNRRTVLYFTYHFVIERYLSTVVLSFAISYVLCLLIETPVRNLIKPSKKSKPSGVGARHRQNQDKRFKLMEMSEIGKLSQSKQERLRNRNIYLPEGARTSELAQIPSSPDPEIPVVARKGLYPAILSETQNEALEAARGPAYRNVAFETLSKTVTFESEEPTVINPVYLSLLDEPNSPAVMQERPTLQRHQQAADSIYATVKSEGKNSTKSLENVQQTTASSPTQANETPADVGHQSGKVREQPQADSIYPQVQHIEADVETPHSFVDDSVEPPLVFPSSVQFSTVASLENPPSSAIFPPEVTGFVNEAYEPENSDPDLVLPSAPPETPESGRSESSKKNVPVLA